MSQAKELPPYSSLGEFSPTLGLGDTLMGAEAVHKDHLFLLLPVPRGKRMNTGEGPLWNLQMGLIPSQRDVLVCHQDPHKS